MRLKSLERVEVGDVLAKPVYDNKCQLLLSKDTLLTQKYIDRLIHSDIQCVYIEDDLSEGLEAKSIVSDELKIKSVSVVKNAFKDLAVRKNSNYIIKSVEQITDIIDEMLAVIYDNHGTLYCMAELMGTDMYTYNHCAEVAILSMLVAKNMNFNEKFIKKIGMGAILHDIGKMAISGDLLNKPDPLSLEEIVTLREHVRTGYELLKDNSAISPISRQIVHLHHEKLNGAGYPYQMKGDQIPIHVRIVTLCDIFNAISSNRAYRARVNADEALEIIRAEAVYELDRNIYYHLLRVINIYPPGTLVQLSNGEVAIVIKENPEAQTRPLVQVVRQKKLCEKIDLMDYLTLFIEKTIEI